MKAILAMLCAVGGAVVAAAAPPAPVGLATDPHVTALRGVWAASHGKDAVRFATYVAPDADLRIERTDGRFTVSSLSRYAAQCRFKDDIAFNHPKAGNPHFGKPFTSWASTRIACTGMPGSDYALTVWFDAAGKITSGHLLTPPAVPS